MNDSYVNIYRDRELENECNWATVTYFTLLKLIIYVKIDSVNYYRLIPVIIIQYMEIGMIIWYWELKVNLDAELISWYATYPIHLGRWRFTTLSTNLVY